jgi:CBS domain-containing protein
MTSRHNTPAWIARALGVALLAAAASAGAQTVKIGNTGALTGPYNEFGEGTRRGIELAIDRINAKGGVLGRKVELAISLDDQLVPDRAVQNIRKILDAPEIDVIVGPGGSGPTLAVIDMVTVEADTSLAEAGALFLSSGLSRIPVIGDDTDDIVGVLYLRDVARISLDKKAAPRGATVRSLAREAVFIPELKKADDALRDMQAKESELYARIAATQQAMRGRGLAPDTVALIRPFGTSWRPREEATADWLDRRRLHATTTRTAWGLMADWHPFYR